MALNQYPFYVSKLSCLQFWVQDGSVHIYDLQTGQWVSSFEAAQGTEDLYSLKLPVVIFYLNLGFNIKYILNLSPLSDLLVS
jgi:hypothetical protein